MRAALLPLAIALTMASSASGGGIRYVDDDADPAGDGLTWETAYRFLQDALAEADASGGAITEIRVAQGRYTPDRSEASPRGTGDREAAFDIAGGVTVSGGYLGLLAGDGEDPDDRDIDAYETRLSGDLLGNDIHPFHQHEENSFHVVTVIDVATEVVLDGLTITEGTADGGGTNDDGAGLYVSHGVISVTDCTVSWCTSDARAAGVHCRLSMVSFSRVAVIDNRSIFMGGGMSLYFGEAVVADCEFRRNVLLDLDSFGIGAGLHLVSCYAALVVDCHFAENVAPGQAGLRMELCDRPVIVGCTFEENVATVQCCGAIGSTRNDEPLILECDFIGNHSELGAALASGNEQLDVINCRFTGNSSTSHAAAISLYGDGDEEFTITNTLIAGNTSVDGGAVSCHDESRGRLVACTVVQNMSESGAAIQEVSPDATVSVSSCIVFGNAGGQISATPGVATVEYSVVEGGFPGVGNIDADPLFVDPEGGDFRLSAGSPAIDAGDSTAVCPQTDLDGNVRTVDDPAVADGGVGGPPTVDMGAYEFGSSAPSDPIDCNGDYLDDRCGIAAGLDDDCNGNLVPDECDLESGSSFDCNGNLIPDDCEGDANVDGRIDLLDLAMVIADWGSTGPTAADVNDDGVVDVQDLIMVLTNWCP